MREASFNRLWTQSAFLQPGHNALYMSVLLEHAAILSELEEYKPQQGLQDQQSPRQATHSEKRCSTRKRVGCIGQLGGI